MTKQPIWFDPSVTIDQLKQLNEPTLGKHLGMEWTEIGPDYLSMKMPVDDRTRQPYGLLHGGASCALAETVGSVASHLVIDAAHFICVGLEINANHLKAVRNGFVTATARPVHLGASTHVWDIRIVSDTGKLVCISRLTVAILSRKHKQLND
jgi:1,4-dihydroxy-2-naphthoyl-CoA hydrolase